MSTMDTIADFVHREFLFDEKERKPQADDTLVGPGGVVDSVGLHQLITFIETSFGIEVGDLDILPENFETLSALGSYVDRKRAGS